MWLDQTCYLIRYRCVDRLIHFFWRIHLAFQMLLQTILNRKSIHNSLISVCGFIHSEAQTQKIKQRLVFWFSSHSQPRTIHRFAGVKTSVIRHMCRCRACHSVTVPDRGSAGLGSSHARQGAFMHSTDPSLSSHLLAPPPRHDSMINHRTHNGRARAPSRPWAAPSDLYNLMRIRHQVNNEWRSPSGAANSILLRVTSHPGPFTTMLLNMSFNPLKYQRWTNHINLDIASPGPRTHYALSTEPQPPHLLCPQPLTDNSTQPWLQFFSFLPHFMYSFFIAVKDTAKNFFL